MSSPPLPEIESAAAPAVSPGLRRMRAIATGLLLLMLAIFVLSSMLQGRYPVLDYLRAFAEAATVGASADWFAVTALFRHPLGIPIPHTAIVPRNKQRIGEALGRFISNNFLAPEAIEAKLEHFDAAGWAARWLAEPGHAEMAAERLSGTLPLMLDLVGHERSRQFGRDLIRKGIDSVAVAPMIARVLSALMKHGQDQKLYDLAVEAGAKFLSQNTETIRATLSQHSVSWVPDWVDARLAAKLISGLNKTLAEMRDPEHAFRGDFHTAAAKLIRQFAEDPGLYEQCERVKSEVLDNAVVESYLDWMAGEVEARIAADTATADSLLLNGLKHALQVIARWLEQDQRIRAAVNRSIRTAVLSTVVPNRSEIAAFIAGEVSRWDSRTLVARAENQLGRDLQFIRINGTVVGGLVGLTIFIAQKLLGG
jgi:uncharacterized membrane-anchored protein YjiN (DUF445 family)